MISPIRLHNFGQLEHVASQGLRPVYLPRFVFDPLMITDLPITHATIYALSSSQSPVPGFGDNRLILSGLPSHSLASDGGSRFTVMFGQI